MFIKRRLRDKEGQGHQRDTTIHCMEQMGLMECYVWDVRGFDGYGNCLTRVREALDPHDGERREKGEGVTYPDGVDNKPSLKCSTALGNKI